MSKTKWFFVALLYSVLVGCSSDDLPEGVLKEKEMVPILLDVYLAEGKVNELRVKRDSALILFEVYETKILEKYDLTDSAYTQSISYYYEHPIKLERIYETVLDSLNLLEKRLDESKESKGDGDAQLDKKDSVEVKPEKIVGA